MSVDKHVAENIGSPFEQRVRKKINENNVRPVKERDGEFRGSMPCDNCKTTGIVKRDSKIWMRGSTPVWDDKLYCSNCGETHKVRGGKYDYKTGEIDDVDDLRWKDP